MEEQKQSNDSAGEERGPVGDGTLQGPGIDPGGNMQGEAGPEVQDDKIKEPLPLAPEKAQAADAAFHQTAKKKLFDGSPQEEAGKTTEGTDPAE